MGKCDTLNLNTYIDPASVGPENSFNIKGSHFTESMEPNTQGNTSHSTIPTKMTRILQGYSWVIRPIVKVTHAHMHTICNI